MAYSFPFRSSVHRIEETVLRIAADTTSQNQQQRASFDNVLELVNASSSQQSQVEQLMIQVQAMIECFSRSNPGPQVAINEQTVNESPDTPIAVQFQSDDLRGFQNFHECEDDCDCICHMRSRSCWRSPQILRNIVGLFLLNFSGSFGLSILKPACSSKKCKSFSTCALKVTYCLPRWFLMKAAHFAAERTRYGEIHIMPFMQRRTAEFSGNSIYHLAQEDDVAGIKKLLGDREVMPNDATYEDGATALHVSMKRSTIHAYMLTTMGKVCGRKV